MGKRNSLSPEENIQGHWGEAAVGEVLVMQAWT